MTKSNYSLRELASLWIKQSNSDPVDADIFLPLFVLITDCVRVYLHERLDWGLAKIQNQDGKQSGKKRKTQKQECQEFINQWEEECKEYARDFLLYVRAKNIIWIFYDDNYARKRCIDAIRLFITEQEIPENHSLWELISQALRKGSKKEENKKEGSKEEKTQKEDNKNKEAKKILFRRLDADLSKNNSNWAIWTSAPEDFDKKPFNLDNFLSRARKIPVYSPKQQANKIPRIIPPKTAMKVVTYLLEAAGGPIPFSFLFEEAKNHVVMGYQNEGKKEISLSPLSDEPARHSIELELFREQFWHEDKFPLYRAELTEEAKPRSERIWRKLSEVEGNELFCLYFLPVYYLEKNLHQNQFGKPQRISEKEKIIREIMAQELVIERLPVHEIGEGAFEKFLHRVIRLVAERLKKKCSEKGWNVNLS